MTPLGIVAFLDGRPGHEKQTRGVLQALAARTPIRMDHVQLGAPSATSRLRDLLVYACRWIAPAVMEPPVTGRVDLIIGTGARTHIPMILYRRAHGGRIVTCMTPDLFIRKRIDLCLVPRHDAVTTGGNVFQTIGPPAAGSGEGLHDPRKGLILLGGVDNKSHVWDSKALLGQVDAIVQRRRDIQWTISSSPRTPEDMLALMTTYADENDHVRFFKSSDTPSGWIERAYAASGIVWVTADSISMVYEALSAGCGVGILPVRWKRPRNKFQTSIDYLVAHGRVVTYEGWLHGGKPAPGPPLDEAGRCAEEILRRWWPNRLDPEAVK